MESDFEALYQEELAKRAQAEAVLDIVAQLNSHLGLRASLTAVVQITKQILNVPVVCISLRQGESNSGFAINSGLPEAIQQPVPQDVLNKYASIQQSGRVALISDAASIPPHEPDIDLYCKSDVCTIVVVNLNINDMLVGFLQICTLNKVRHFSEDDLSMLTDIADQAAISIHRAQLYEQVQNHAKELELYASNRASALEVSNREKEEALNALRTYTEELQIQNAELDAFAHTVAHDLHSPLSVMIGLADLLLDDEEPLPLDVQVEYLKRIMRQGHKMHNIVNEILLLASIRKSEVQASPIVNMGVIVHEAMKRVSRLMEEHEPDIVQPDSWPVAIGYGPWIEEVWANYLSNAVKYGGRPPRLELRASTANGMARFGVKDNGEGLTAEAQARLFTPFTRLHQVRIGSHGLGLSIVHRILTKLDGRVGVVSQPGQGSFFYFELPLNAD